MKGRYKKNFKEINSFYVFGNYRDKNNKKSMHCLHRFLLNPKNENVIDHKNHNGLINTRSNLRELTHPENMQNRKGAQSNNKLGIRGVTWDDVNKKYRVYVTLNNKNIWIGRFENITDAKNASIDYRRKLLPYADGK